MSMETTLEPLDLWWIMRLGWQIWEKLIAFEHSRSLGTNCTLLNKLTVYRILARKAGTILSWLCTKINVFSIFTIDSTIKTHLWHLSAMKSVKIVFYAMLVVEDRMHERKHVDRDRLTIGFHEEEWQRRNLKVPCPKSSDQSLQRFRKWNLKCNWSTRVSKGKSAPSHSGSSLRANCSPGLVLS